MIKTVTTGIGEMTMHEWKVWLNMFQEWKTAHGHTEDMGLYAVVMFEKAFNTLSLRRSTEDEMRKKRCRR